MSRTSAKGDCGSFSLKHKQSQMEFATETLTRREKLDTR